MRSLSGTLFKGIILSTLLVLAAAGSVLYVSVRAQLVRQMDESLLDKARMLALSVEEKSYGLEVDLEEMRVQDLAEAPIPEYVTVAMPDGRILYRSPGEQGGAVPELPDAAPAEKQLWGSTADGRRVRSVLVGFLPGVDLEEDEEGPGEGDDVVVDTLWAGGEVVWLQLSRDAGDLERFLRVFLVILVVTGLAVMGVLCLTVRAIIRIGAGPVGELASNIEQISDEDLTARISEGTGLRELAPITKRLNHLLMRLEQSFARERGFTSNAAHELRTPLAALRSTIEVALSRKRDADQYRDSLERALGVVVHLENLVGGLLALARMESGQEQPNLSTVRLDMCIRDAWDPYAPEAGKKGVRAYLDLSDPVEVFTDRDLFMRVLEELFRNAVSYVDQGGVIRTTLSRVNGEATVKVMNSGSGIGTEDASMVFNRFWRGSSSREETGSRFGLGLPIALKVVEMLGGRLSVTSELNGEFVATVIVPGR